MIGYVIRNAVDPDQADFAFMPNGYLSSDYYPVTVSSNDRDAMIFASPVAAAQALLRMNTDDDLSVYNFVITPNRRGERVTAAELHRLLKAADSDPFTAGCPQCGVIAGLCCVERDERMSNAGEQRLPHPARFIAAQTYVLWLMLHDNDRARLTGRADTTTGETECTHLPT